MKQTNRRVFMMQVALGSTALAAQQAMAQAMVNEKDPQAAALGYAADTTKVDAKKFPKHAASQKCNNCALYQAKATCIMNTRRLVCFIKFPLKLLKI